MTAPQIIATLKDGFINERFQFDFLVSQYIAGDQNKVLRQEIIKQVTGQIKPATKCGIHAVADILTAKFQQKELF